MEPLFVAIILVVAVTFFFWILPIAIVATNPKIERLEKILWILGMFLFSWLVFVVYLFMAPSRD